MLEKVDPSKNRWNSVWMVKSILSVAETQGIIQVQENKMYEAETMCSDGQQPGKEWVHQRIHKNVSVKQKNIWKVDYTGLGHRSNKWRYIRKRVRNLEIIGKRNDNASAIYGNNNYADK